MTVRVTQPPAKARGLPGPVIQEELSMVRYTTVAVANFYAWHRRRLHLWLLCLILAMMVVLA